MQLTKLCEQTLPVPNIKELSTIVSEEKCFNGLK